MTVDGVWPMFQADAERTGYSTVHAGIREQPGINWRSDTWGLTTSPVVADDTIYFGTGLRHKHVHAIDVKTGEESWRAAIDGREENVLAVADGVVYVGTDRLYALDASTGDTLWEDTRDVSAGITIADGRVFAPSDATDRLRAFNAETGDELWTAGSLGGQLSATAVPSVHDDRLYLSSYEDLYVLDVETGDQVLQTALGERSRAAPTVTDDLVYVPTESRLRALDTASGDERWQYRGGFRRSSPAVVDETLYVAGQFDEGDDRASAVAALDATSGDEQWRVELPGAAPGSPVATTETVYLGTTDGRLYALDAATGDVRWSLQFEWTIGTPALLEDELVVSVGGRLYSIGRGDDPNASPWAGVVDAPSEPADSGSTEYPDVDFYFGTHGYDVETDSEVNTESDAPFDLTVEVTGDRIDADEEVTIAFEFTNESDERLAIDGGAAAPFEVVQFTERNGDRRLTAWSDAYEDGHVHTTTHRGVVGWNDIGITTPVDPGETLQETYTLSHETHGIQPGSYSFTNSYAVRRGDRPRSDEDEVWNPGVWVAAELSQPAREEGTVLYDLAISEQADVPDEFVGDFSVDVLEPISDVHPGLIEITLENVEGVLDSVASPRRLPFGSYVGVANDGSRLVLLSEGMYAPAYVEHRDDSGSWVPRFLPHVESHRSWSTRRFEPDATFSRRFLVLDYPGAEDPVTAGDYLFSQGFADGDVEFPWGFRLSLRGSR